MRSIASKSYLIVVLKLLVFRCVHNFLISLFDSLYHPIIRWPLKHHVTMTQWLYISSNKYFHDQHVPMTQLPPCHMTSDPMNQWPRMYQLAFSRADWSQKAWAGLARQQTQNTTLAWIGLRRFWNIWAKLSMGLEESAISELGSARARKKAEYPSWTYFHQIELIWTYFVEPVRCIFYRCKSVAS